MSDEFQAANSIPKAQHGSASPQKGERPDSKDSTPKSQVVIPRLKLPLNNGGNGVTNSHNDVSEISQFQFE